MNYFWWINSRKSEKRGLCLVLLLKLKCPQTLEWPTERLSIKHEQDGVKRLLLLPWGNLPSPPQGGDGETREEGREKRREDTSAQGHQNQEGEEQTPPKHIWAEEEEVAKEEEEPDVCLLRRRQVTWLLRLGVLNPRAPHWPGVRRCTCTSVLVREHMRRSTGVFSHSRRGGTVDGGFTSIKVMLEKWKYM